MSENTKLWDTLGKTDPAHTKGFTRGGGFKGTAIKPMWSYRRMTEEFGPCGQGWAVGQPDFQTVPGTDGEILVFCTVPVWWREPGEKQIVNTLYGVGGDKVVAKFSSGLKSDDEAFKKAFTDAVTNALKLIGVGADVHMGLFDDSKYVNAMREEFSEPQPAEPPVKSSAQLKREDAFAPFIRELDECQTLVSLEKFKTAWRAKIVADGWTAAWKSAAKDRIEGREKAIMEEMERLSEAGDAELSRLPAREQFEHSVNVLAGG